MCVRVVYCVVGLCNVWKGPTLPCMYDYLRFTVCMGPTSQCPCIVGRCTVC